MTQLDLSQKPRARAALAIATKWHAGQVRKYTGEPYVEHPKSVASILLRHGIYDENMLCAALLHDVLEDTDCPEDVISSQCGGVVLRWVKLLTDTEQGNRATRKELARKRLSQAPSQVQAVKLADMIDNTSTIVEHDPKFARLYLEEKKALVDCLTLGREKHGRLWHAARDSYTAGLNALAVRELKLAFAAAAEAAKEEAEIAQIIHEEELLDLAEIALF